MATTTDYKAQLQGLLPPGRLWDALREDGSLADQLLAALAEEFARVNDRAESLLNEANPRATYELLAEWEAFANLPDTCTGSTLTLQERRAVLVQRLTATGGQSVTYFQSVVKRLGYTVEITEYRPFICGISQCGMQALNPPKMRFVWRVRLTDPRVTYFRCGESQVGTDPLLKINRAEDLECVLRRVKPAHTSLFVSYEGA